MKAKDIEKGLAYHIVDTTALLSSTNPIYSAMEVGIAGMSDKISIDSRITVAGISYAGLGFAFARGRDISRKIFNINGITNEKVQTFHDMVYTVGFNLTFSPIIYLSIGADIKQTVIGGLSAAALSAIVGPIMGYSVDISRDLTGMQECRRPSYKKIGIKNQKPFIKKGLAGLLVAGSISAMAGVYALNPDDNKMPNYNEVSIKQVLETQDI